LIWTDPAGWPDDPVLCDSIRRHAHLERTGAGS